MLLYFCYFEGEKKSKENLNMFGALSSSKYFFEEGPQSGVHKLIVLAIQSNCQYPLYLYLILFSVLVFNSLSILVENNNN